MYNVAIIGAGLIGQKRAAALRPFENCQLKAVGDINRRAAELLCRQFGGQPYDDWNKIVVRDDVDIVVASTVNKFLAPVSVAALRTGKHVLCEKPLGRNSYESQLMLESARCSGTILKTGFNHRHHPAIAKAKHFVDKGEIGEVIFLRCRYGHGGRPGYEKEWRANKELCGGGELLDQGIHVADLFRWFAGDFDEVFGHTSTCFWNMEVEDNAFAMFRRKDGVFATMHTSWTQWKNLFSFEIFGSTGYMVLEGLGGSYGKEILTIGRRNPEGGSPNENRIEFPETDISWQEEWKEFISAVKTGAEPMGNGWDGLQANRMIEAVYKSAETNEVVKL